MDELERRKFRRLARDSQVTVKALAFPLESGVAVGVEMQDISEGGVGVTSPASFEVEQTVEVTIKLPGWFKFTTTMTRYRDDHTPLTAVGTVKRCSALEMGGFDLGIEFTDIWEDHWKAMRQHLTELQGEADSE